ncbi:MAG: AsnC family transcriptional regulator [Candidatus Bathyarchaeia archaeon]
MDEVDRVMISELQQDGRKSLEELAKKVGYTSMGVRKRLQRLILMGAIRVSATVSPFFYKLFPALVMLEMESGEAMKNLLERFRDCPRVIQIYKTIGGYNLIALVVAEDLDTLESISIEKCSLRSGSGIRRSEFYPIGDIHFSPYLQIREYLTHKNMRIAPCNVDCKPCTRFIDKKCVGCPTTIYYRGTL